MAKPKRGAAAAKSSAAKSTEDPIAKGAEESIMGKETTQDLQHGKPEGKNNPRRPRPQDSAHALLSLGNDLSAEDEAAESISAEANKKIKVDDGTAQEKGNAAEAGNGQGTPKDFLYWLPANQPVGDWDVLCGRGGESNNYVGNKKYRIVIKDRKVSPRRNEAISHLLFLFQRRTELLSRLIAWDEDVIRSACICSLTQLHCFLLFQEEYRKIDPKQRKQKTAFVRDVVQHINQCGGRFIDIDKFGRRYVVTMEKARKKTSQALRETKELKWLDIDQKNDKKSPSQKEVVCPFCQKSGHKTRIAKDCLFHHQWLDAGKSNENSASGGRPSASVDSDGIAPAKAITKAATVSANV